jgi:hypothetical protein
MGAFKVPAALAVPPTASIAGSATPNARRLTETMNREKNFGFVFNGDANLRHEPTYFVKIYNLSEFEHRIERPWVHPQRFGNLIVIPACESGQPYSKPFRIPDIVQMRTERPGSVELGVRGVDGRFLAQDALNPDDPTGNWKTMKPIPAGQAANEGTNLYNFGLFWTIEPEPTAEELAKARERLEGTYNHLIEEANLLALDGAAGTKMIGHLHRRAANYFGIDVEWNRRFTRKVECPECGAANIQTASVCSKCPMVFSWERALRNGLRTVAQAQAIGITADQIAQMLNPGAETGHPANEAQESPSPKRKTRAKAKV